MKIAAEPTAHGLAAIRGVLLDLDGTLYVGGRLLSSTLQFLDSLARHDLPYVCLTNNSSARSTDYVDKLRRLGVRVTPEQVLTSGQATIHHLQSCTAHRSAYVVGTTALQQEFADSGIRLDEHDPDCLVLGYDTELDYRKLSIATRLLLAGKPYFATHPDRTCISEQGLLPDIALLIDGLRAVTGRQPVILGKPERPMIDAAAARLDLPVASLAMVGDQLDTDMTMATRHGLFGVLVLSGETKLAQLELSAVQPSIVVEHVGDLAQLLDAARV